MDHQHEHQQHQQKEREHQKDESKQHKHAQERQIRTIHPAWFVTLGVVLVVSAMMLWTSL